jgi:hypothetical protein
MQGQTASYVLKTLLSAPASAGLTTLANVKDELNITDDSNDTSLTRFIAEESAAISRYCNRIFGLATWQDEFRPQRGVRGEGVRGASNPLKLSRWPLATNAMSFVGNTTQNNLVISGIVSTAGLYAGMPVFGSGVQDVQATSAQTSTLASGVPSGATISTVNPTSVVLSAPVTVSQTQATFTAGLSVQETVAGQTSQLVVGNDFEVDSGSLLPGDEGNAMLYRLNEFGRPRTWPPGRIVVVYQAGYALPNDDYGSNVATLPSDLETACIRLVVGRFRARGRDPMLRSKNQPTIGGEQYWVGATPGQTGPYPNDIMAILNAYRTPVTA